MVLGQVIFLNVRILILKICCTDAEKSVKRFSVNLYSCIDRTHAYCQFCGSFPIALFLDAGSLLAL